MKKLVVLLVFLALASAASAGYVVAFTTPGSTEVHASDNIVVNLWSDDPAIIGVTIDAVADNQTNNSASVAIPQWPVGPPAWQGTSTPVALNDGVALMVNIYANETTAVMTGILWSFLYHVPALTESTTIRIGGLTLNDILGDPIYFPPEVANLTGTIYTPTELVLHVVPEPITITLLGLGSLLMLRRKK